MEIREIVSKLEASGVTVRPVGDDLAIDAPGPLTDKQRRFLRKHKGRLVKHLRATVPDFPEALCSS